MGLLGPSRMGLFRRNRDGCFSTRGYGEKQSRDDELLTIRNILETIIRTTSPPGAPTQVQGSVVSCVSTECFLLSPSGWGCLIVASALGLSGHKNLIGDTRKEKR